MTANFQHSQDWLITPFPNPFVLPSLPLKTVTVEVFQDLPAISAIYFILLPVHTQVLYIGRSHNLRGRFIDPSGFSPSIIHHEAKQAIQTALEYSEKVTMTWIETNSRLPYSPSCLETHLIAKFQPLFNKQGKDTNRYAARQRSQRLAKILNEVFHPNTFSPPPPTPVTPETPISDDSLLPNSLPSQIIASQAYTLALLTTEIDSLRRRINDLEESKKTLRSITPEILPLQSSTFKSEV